MTWNANEWEGMESGGSGMKPDAVGLNEMPLSRRDCDGKWTMIRLNAIEREGMPWNRMVSVSLQWNGM